MPTKTVKKSAPVPEPAYAPRARAKREPEHDDREPRATDSDRDRDRDRDDRGSDRDRDNRSSSSRGREEEKSEFVNITKLFETKKNPDNLVGTCKPEFLPNLRELFDTAEAENKGVTFFVFTAGKWGASLAATLSKDQPGHFSDGDRGRGQSRGRGRY